MLEKITIKNFQSHKSTEVDLSRNVNVIQGNSDCGKSAVMRALAWLVFNPAGDYFVSDWARKGKSISSPCEVTLVVDGHVVTRRRDKDFNGYVLDGKEFEATRNSVPPQVEKVLGIGEVNVQRQLDPPFLLAMSSGEVSRYINSLVNLTRIDEWTAKSKSRGNLLSQNAESAAARLEAAQKKVDSYSFLPELEEISKKLTENAEAAFGMDSSIKELQRGLSDHELWKSSLEKIPDVDKLFELLADAENKFRELNEKRSRAEEVSREVHDFLLLDEKLGRIPDLSAAEKELSKAQEVREKMSMLNRRVTELSEELKARSKISVPSVPPEFFEIVETLQRYKNVQGRIEESVRSLQKEIELHSKALAECQKSSEEFALVEKELSTMVCPLCGRSGIHEESPSCYNVEQ